MKRPILKSVLVGLLLASPLAAMADPVDLVAAAMTALNGSAFLFGSEVFTMALASAVVYGAPAAHGTYRRRKADGGQP